MFFILTLSFWLGLYALRTYVPSAVWNLADELPLGYKPIFAVTTHLVGLLGIFVVRRMQHRAFGALAIAFAAFTVARQVFMAVDSAGPWLSLLGWILWLWFMMALAEEVTAQDAEHQLAPALAAAVALQLGMQAAWHGLDLQSVSGPTATACVTLLAVALVTLVRRLPCVPMRRPDASLAWVLLGVALFLEATLVGNAGRFSQMTAWRLPIAVAVLQVTALVASILASRATAFWLRITFIVISFIAVFGLPGLTRWTALPVLAVQVVTICGLREAADQRLRWSASTLFAVGAFLFFVFIFGFYNSYELAPLWILALALVAIASVLPQRDGVWPARPHFAAFGVAFVITLLYFTPPPRALAPSRADLTVLSYNIHHGFNDAGVPGMQRTAAEIARLNPDIVALQEIGRGWTLLGGNDLVSYLEWRFREYSIHYAPTNGQLWGNAIMSRLPLTAPDGVTFDAPPGTFRYGYAYAGVEYGGRLLFLSVHLTADLEARGGNARSIQANEVLHHVLAVRRRGTRVLVAGDFNASPQDEPIRILRMSLTDLSAQAGLAEIPTWPALRGTDRIDYVFGQGFDVVGGMVPRVTASDHLPVLVTLR